MGDWIVFGDQQTAKLDVANGRMVDALHIFGTCEQLQAAAVKRSKPRFLGVF